MSGGPLWQRMDTQPRRSIATLRAVDIPDSPGVYALYRDGERMYIGKAAYLWNRLWKNHSGRGAVMTGSAMRRNVAEHLGIATSADIKSHRYQPAADEVLAVGAWLDGCDIAWAKCDSKKAAKDLEEDFKAEYKPPLTKR